jgi:SpoVK/Ycf46/Vps4 family AAA+-type ATPase
MYLFGQLPSQTVIRQLDYQKAVRSLKEKFGSNILQALHQTGIECGSRKEEEERTVFVFEGELVLEMGADYAILYHAAASSAQLAAQIKEQLTGTRKRARRKQYEINIITSGSYGLELSDMEIKRTKIDLDLYYEDEFKETDKTICKKLNEKNGKGIVLLHGLPGTGKTTYLRYLVGRIRKRVLFLPPDIAGRMSHPELVKLLIDNPESVLIIEDAESILMQRRLGGDSAVSSLLNISDGLMSDFMRAQLICTFNSGLENIDPALMRKGRLIARYEFGKLSVEKATRLSRHLGFSNCITEPMTVAEITNQQERSYEQPGRTMIGFRAGAAAGS